MAGKQTNTGRPVKGSVSRQNSSLTKTKTDADVVPSITVDITKSGGKVTSVKVRDGARPSESPEASSTAPEEGRERVDSAGSGISSGRRTIESAKKKILWLASKSEWSSLEQNLKSLELSIAGSKDPSDQYPLANIQDEVYYTIKN